MLSVYYDKICLEFASHHVHYTNVEVIARSGQHTSCCMQFTFVKNH